ncbi:MAG: hypothetical protein JJE16_07840 [Nitrospiraceae bacterium]|nr:hypothetical protein [Nitrospiraceae bacterium]
MQTTISARTLRMILLWAEEGKNHQRFGRLEKKRHPHITRGVLLRGLRLAFLMQALVAFAHRPARLSLREDILNLRLAARKIAIG